MRKLFFILAFFVGLLASATTAMAQTVNMSRYITLTVKKDSAIKLNFKAAAAGTPVRIVSGSNMVDITVGTSWKGRDTYTAGSTTLTIYGDITSLECDGNRENLTAIDLSHNTQLTELDCSYNHIRSLDVSGCSQLSILKCSYNKLNSLKVSNLTELDVLYCFHNQLRSLDVSGCTKLAVLYCFHNQLNSLDVSRCTQLVELSCGDNEFLSLDLNSCPLLEKLNCSKNRLTSLNVGSNTRLREVYCYGNYFTTGAIDTLFCSLPNRYEVDKGCIYPATSPYTQDKLAVLAADSTTAFSKYWKVLYNSGGEIKTTGSYTCSVPNMGRYISLTVAKDSPIRLNLKAASEGTPVSIVSGNNRVNIYVGTTWFDTSGVLSNFFVQSSSQHTSMTIYGDVTAFDCGNNYDNITAVDASHNTELVSLSCSSNKITNVNINGCTKLKYISCSDNLLTSLDIRSCTNLERLDCWGNNFSTDTLNSIYCSLPNRTGQSEEGYVVPLYDSDSMSPIVAATDRRNATNKNWIVAAYNSGARDEITTQGYYVCGVGSVNMNRYITLTVADGERIDLSLTADSYGTPVRIVSGSNTEDIVVDLNGTRSQYVTDDNTMTIYGDITELDCSDNETNITDIDVSANTLLTTLLCSNNELTSLDVSNNGALTNLWCFSNRLNSLDISNNTNLATLFCYNNAFSTAALDAIYCALPDRRSKTEGMIKVLKNTSDPKTDTAVATTAGNAAEKNWRVLYSEGNIDIATTGSYVCGVGNVNTDSYITLTVRKGETVRLDLKADGATPCKIESGGRSRIVAVGNGWFDGNTPSNFTFTADSSTLTIYGDITALSCSSNGEKLIAIDPSHNTELRELYCYDNRITAAIDVSRNTNLEKLYCWGNAFTTNALDRIYCNLPDREGKTEGVIKPLYADWSDNSTTVVATNKTNATAKNWKVQYESDTDIATTGKHKCSATDIAEAAAEQALTLYPNPVSDVLYLSATARTIRIYNIYGIEVAHATDTDRIDVASLPAGVYTVRADGTVAKMVKR